MTSPKQGDGSHLAHGSITAEINRLRQQVEARNATIATLEARVRRLEGALRDMTSAASQAGRVLDGGT